MSVTRVQALGTTRACLAKPISIILGHGSGILAYKSGKIHINLTSDYSIDIGAMDVPSFSISLPSIGQLFSKYSVMFARPACYIMSRSPGSTNQQIKLTVLTNGLYRMKADVTSHRTRGAKIFAAANMTKPDLELWHQHFGHISQSSL